MPKRSIKRKSFEAVKKCGEIFYHNHTFTIICSNCDEKYLDFQTFLCHFKDVHSKYEDEATSEYTAIFESINSVLPDFSTNGKDNSNDEENDDLEYGPISEKNSETVVEEINMYPKNLRRSHICEECGIKFVSIQDLKMHLKKKHLDIKEHPTSQCEETFKKKNSKSKLDRDSHVLLSCLVCQKLFKNRCNLKRHSETHNEDQNFICDFKDCGKMFKNRRRLRDHSRLHTAKRNYVCEICGYRTFGKYTLDAHIRTHTGEKPYACKTCGKHFISMSMVKEHAATHSTERRHKCNVCEASFTRPKALYHHMPLHLGIRKFHCSICDKRYTQAAGLSAHMRKHKIDGKIRLGLG